jgi:hypothetical protein
MNKKGLSTVVASLILILLTISIALLLAQVIIPFVRDNLAKSTNCLDYQDYFVFEESFQYNSTTYNFNCIDSVGTDNLHGLAVKALKNNSNVKGFKIVFTKDESVSIDVIEGNPSSSDSGQIRTIEKSPIIRIPGLGEIRTFVYNSPLAFNKAEIYPILSTGKTCDKNDEIKFINCSSNINLA